VTPPVPERPPDETAPPVAVLPPVLVTPPVPTVPPDAGAPPIPAPAERSSPEQAAIIRALTINAIPGRVLDLIAST
jgi:hypothetical protein